MLPTLYTQKTIYVSRDVPINTYKSLKTVNKKTGLTIEEELLEFCRTPRGVNDLKEFLGLRNKQMVQARFTNPLLKQGKLKFIYPESPTSNLQRYLNAEVDITPEMQETIAQLSKTEKHLELEKMTLDFCKIPRTLGEIKEHVGLAGYDIVRKRAVQPLIDQGKIKLMYPHNPLYKMQKYVVSDSELGFEPFTEDGILAYCETPRSKDEIEKHFAVGQDLLYKVLNPIIAQGKLVYTKSARKSSTITHSKLVRCSCPQPIVKKSEITDADILEFCSIPRFCYEIMKALEINDYTCRKFVARLMWAGQLVYTIEKTHGHRKIVKNG